MATNPDPSFSIVHVKTDDDAEKYREAFVSAYIEVFAGDPYYEAFTREEASAIYTKLVRTPGNITLLTVADDGDLAAFGIAIPLASRPDVARELTGLVPVRHTYYLAELGVVERHRGHGLARTLIRERLLHLDRDRCTHVVLRVSASDEDRSKRLYAKLGFQDMGVYMEVPALRTDGEVRTDRRLFLSRVLSQVPL